MASKRHLRIKLQRQACGHKIQHANQGNAGRAASHMRDTTGANFRSYRCPYCHSWHIGHTR